jgi:Skp family chaperone for outer membrane proteins
MPTPRPGLLCSLSVAALVATSPVRAQDKPIALEKVVGVVDFVKTIDAYPRFAEERKRLEGKRKAMQDELDGEQKKIDDMQGQRDLLPRESKERAQKELQIDLSLRNLQGQRDIAQADMRQQYDKLLVSVYEDIEVAIKKVAQEKGLKLVLRVHRDVGNDTVPGKARLYESRIVWYAADEVDLTPAVIKLLQVPLAEAKDSAVKPPEAARPNNDKSPNDKK